MCITFVDNQIVGQIQVMEIVAYPSSWQLTRPGSNSPWLFRHSPFSCRLKRRSSRSKSWGEREGILPLAGLAQPRPRTLPFCPGTLTWEPVQPRRAKGNWLLGVTTRSTLTALCVGQGCRGPSKAACGGCGKHKMQKLLSKASMVWFRHTRWAESPKWLRWYW